MAKLCEDSSSLTFGALTDPTRRTMIAGYDAFWSGSRDKLQRRLERGR
jgi:hypothetical protein